MTPIHREWWRAHAYAADKRCEYLSRSRCASSRGHAPRPLHAGRQSHITSSRHHGVTRRKCAAPHAWARPTSGGHHALTASRNHGAGDTSTLETCQACQSTSRLHDITKSRWEGVRLRTLKCRPPRPSSTHALTQSRRGQQLDACKLRSLPKRRTDSLPATCTWHCHRLQLWQDSVRAVAIPSWCAQLLARQYLQVTAALAVQ